MGALFCVETSLVSGGIPAAVRSIFARSRPRFAVAGMLQNVSITASFTAYGEKIFRLTIGIMYTTMLNTKDALRLI
jgi:hypothetical protein